MATTDANELLDAMRSVTLPPNDLKQSNISTDNVVPSKDDLEIDLEKLFLTPNQRFSTEWLNKLQQ
jgi:hypothetical protein